MSDSTVGQTTTAQPEVDGRSDNKWGGALSFPSILLMGAALFLVVLMIILSGWKIVNLDNERTSIDTQRRLLDRDRLAYDKILQELPGLEDRRQNLIRENNELDGKVQSSRTTHESLTTQNNAARSDLDKAKASSNEAQEVAKAARDSYASIQGEIQIKRPELQNLEEKVGALKEEEKTLRTRRDQLQQEISKLQADNSGLEQQKQNKKQVLEQMTQDAGVFQSLSARFGTILEGLDASRKNADKTIDGWKAQGQSIGDTLGGIREKAQDFSKQVQAISGESGELANAIKNFQTSTKVAQQVAGDLQTANSSLNGAITQIQKTVVGVDKETQRLSQTVDSSIGSLQSSVSALSKGTSDLGKAISALDGHIGSLQAKAINMEASVTKFSETSTTVRHTADDLSKTRADLATELVAVKELVSQLQAIDQALDATEKRLRPEPKGATDQ
jgi:chromosome segregation ATPase